MDVLQDEVIKIISNCLGVENLTMQSSIKNTKGWDSIFHLKILMEVEKVYGCTLPIEKLATIESVEDWVNAIKDHK